MECLSIDDHIGIQVVTENQFRNRVPLRDTAVFLGAERAYQAVKLVQHPKKKQREVSQGVFLGAEVDGKIGSFRTPPYFSFDDVHSPCRQTRNSQPPASCEFCSAAGFMC